MAVTNFSPLLGLALPTTGDLSGTWGDVVNQQITDLLDDAIAGTTVISADADVTLTTTQGGDNEARQAILNCVGALTADRLIIAPAQSKAYMVINNTSGGFAVTIVGAGPTTGVRVLNGDRALVAWDGSDFAVIASSAGGINYKTVTSNTTAEDKQGLLANTTGGTFTVTLPASPAVGAQVVIADAGGTWSTNNLTVGRNGSTIAGLAENLVCDIADVSVQFIYSGSTWEVYAQVGAFGGTNTLLVSPQMTGSVLVNGSYRSNVTAVPSLTIDCSLGNYFTKTISINTSFTFSNAPALVSYAFTLELTHTSGSVTWPGSVQWPSGIAPNITSGKTSLFMFVTDDGGSRWRGAALVDYTT